MTMRKKIFNFNRVLTWSSFLQWCNERDMFWKMNSSSSSSSQSQNHLSFRNEAFCLVQKNNNWVVILIPLVTIKLVLLTNYRRVSEWSKNISTLKNFFFFCSVSLVSPNCFLYVPTYLLCLPYYCLLLYHISL